MDLYGLEDHRCRMLDAASRIFEVASEIGDRVNVFAKVTAEWNEDGGAFGGEGCVSGGGFARCRQGPFRQTVTGIRESDNARSLGVPTRQPQRNFGRGTACRIREQDFVAQLPRF